MLKISSKLGSQLTTKTDAQVAAKIKVNNKKKKYIYIFLSKNENKILKYNESKVDLGGIFTNCDKRSSLTFSERVRLKCDSTCSKPNQMTLCSLQH